METIRYIKSLDVTSIVTDKTDRQKSQSSIRLTNKAKVNTPNKVDNALNTMLSMANSFERIKSSEERKNNKKSFYNKFKSNK